MSLDLPSFDSPLSSLLSSFGSVFSQNARLLRLRFADDSGTSSASGIAYSGFGAVTGTGGSVTGVAGRFDLGTEVSAADTPRIKRRLGI